jgi:hypothetical protein
LVNSEADGRGPVVSRFDQKRWPFRPRQDSNSGPDGTEDLNTCRELAYASMMLGWGEAEDDGVCQEMIGR